MTNQLLDETVRGHQPRGHKRWERAAQWAAIKPDSAQGKKYLKRVAAAKAVVETGNGGIAWEHWDKGYHGRPPQYKGQTCSTECGILQLQLDWGCAGLDELSQKIANPGYHSNNYLVRRPADSKRRGKCLVCGGGVGTPAPGGHRAV